MALEGALLLCSSSGMGEGVKKLDPFLNWFLNREKEGIVAENMELIIR